MKRTGKKSRSWLARLRATAGRYLTPRRCLPCVGLVVLGGCLTLVVMPDDQPAGSASAPAAESSAMPTVVVDPGHGGADEGTKWRGVGEKDLTLDLGFRVERLLKQSGFPTKMTRRENVYVSLDERARVANRITDALFVSLHFNSDPSGGNSSGIETFYARQKEPPASEWSWVGVFNHPEPVEGDTSEVLAGTVQSALIPRTQARDRGIHASNLYVVHHTRCPSILVEGGFISNVFEAQLLSNEQYRETLAQGIVEGVLSYQKMRTRPGGIIPPPHLAGLAP